MDTQLILICLGIMGKGMLGIFTVILAIWGLVALLNRVRTKAIQFAWDNPDIDLTPDFRRFLELTAIKNVRKRKVYVLTNYGSTHEQDLYRVEILRGMGYDPYVMVYDRPSAPPMTRQLQRWVNNKRIFHTVHNFANYIPGRMGGVHRA